VTESALAVLVPARDWAEHNGRRFFVSRMSPLVRSALDICQVKLPELGGRPGRTTAIPTPAPPRTDPPLRRRRGEQSRALVRF
jgi:hypothetical protein